jgi:three-Cys-motif partner protein
LRHYTRTKTKLEILNHYLGAWFGILAHKGFRHVYYIDGFCGPGKYLGGEEGSPVIAARLASSTAQRYPEFKVALIFIDKNPKALMHLETLGEIKNKHPNVRIDLKEGAFAYEIENIIKILNQNPNSPTFSFIDPFGFGQSPFEKLKLLMHNQSSEIFVNFMCGFMNRFKEHENEEIKGKIKDMVGEEDLSNIINATESIDAFCIAFENNLKSIARYTLKFMMRDEKNIRDNAFFFCGSNAMGFKKIKEAMWKVDPEHGNSFSAHREAAKNELQTSLFEITPQTHFLSEMLQEKFNGRQSVSVKEIFKWVVEETETFLECHARIELEYLLEKGIIKSITDPSGSTRMRRANNWPERLLLSFA